MTKDIFTIGGYDFTREELEEWGMEFLQGTDDEIFDMAMLDELEAGRTPMEILNCAHFGEDYYPYGDNGKFNPNRDYFTFDGYGNYMSIPADYVAERVELCLDKNEFVEWCKEQGYIDDDEEEEEE